MKSNNRSKLLLTILYRNKLYIYILKKIVIRKIKEPRENFFLFFLRNPVKVEQLATGDYTKGISIRLIHRTTAFQSFLHRSLYRSRTTTTLRTCSVRQVNGRTFSRATWSILA